VAEKILGLGESTFDSNKHFTATFIGPDHDFDYDGVYGVAKQVIEDLFIEHEQLEFIVGLNGEYDKMISSIIWDTAIFYNRPDCKHTLLVSQFAPELDNLKNLCQLYDKIEIHIDKKADTAEEALSSRNHEAMKQSNYIFFYEHGQKEYIQYKNSNLSNKIVIILGREVFSDY